MTPVIDWLAPGELLSARLAGAAAAAPPAPAAGSGTRSSITAGSLAQTDLRPREHADVEITSYSLVVRSTQSR
jgi:hypothetical protein